MKRSLPKTTFNPDELKLMQSAHKRACAVRSDLHIDEIARKILRAAEAGENDKDRLSDSVIENN